MHLARPAFQSSHPSLSLACTFPSGSRRASDPPHLFPAPIQEQYSNRLTPPMLSLFASGSHDAYSPNGPPGGFEAALHFSAGAPLSATPLGRVPG